MRAHRELRLARRDRLARRAPLLGRQRARQPRDFHRQPVEPCRELAIVLLGEDLGRRHECDRAPALDRLQRGERRHHRLAGADVALQQPLHRLPALEVVRDLAPYLFLCAGQLERHARQQRLRQRAGAGEDRRTALGARPPVHLHRHLLRQELVELEALPRRVRARVERALCQRRQPGRRRVQELHRIAELPQLAAAHEVLGQHLAEPRRIGGERARDDLAQRFLAEAGGGRVDRRQPVGHGRVVVHDGELRMHDLGAEVAFAHVAVHAHAGALLERLLRIGIKGEETQHELRARAAFAFLDLRDELAPRPVLDVAAHDAALGLHGRAGDDARERGQRRAVLVAQRKVQHEVLLAHDVEPRELVGERVGALRSVAFRRRRFRALAGHGGTFVGDGDYAAFVSSKASRHPVCREAIVSVGASTATASTSIRDPRGSAATW